MVEKLKVVFVFSGSSPGERNWLIEAQAESLRQSGVDVHQHRLEGKDLTGYLVNVLQLRRRLRRGRFDIIHSHYGLSAMVTALARRSEKHVASFMGSDLLGLVKPDGRVTLTGRLLRTVSRWVALHGTDFNIVKTPELRRIISRSPRAEVIPNGVDFDVFYPLDGISARKELGIDPGKKIVLFVADPKRPVKNFFLAQQAFSRLDLENGELMVLTGRPQAELNLFYNAADVLLLTSFHEGSVNVVKEAMACSLPIVSTDVGDVRDIMGHTEGCFITDFGVEKTVSMLKKALEFGRRTNGRNDVEHLENGRIARRIIGIYESISRASTSLS